jgi:hypothetical protein
VELPVELELETAAEPLAVTEATADAAPALEAAEATTALPLALDPVEVGGSDRSKRFLGRAKAPSRASTLTRAVTSMVQRVEVYRGQD